MGACVRCIGSGYDQTSVVDWAALGERVHIPMAFYESASGNRPVADVLAQFPDEDRAAIIVDMRRARSLGLAAARHLRGDLYELRVGALNAAYRLIFTQETRFILLALSVFAKRTRRTPERELQLAEHRLRDWRSRGVH
jgi:phage-related protein